jgi:hypothetical protein
MVIPRAVENIRTYGMVAVSQEALVIARRGYGWGDYLKAAMAIKWRAEIPTWWTKGSLWVGGWSFLKLPHTRVPYEILLAAGLAGGAALAAARWWRGRPAGQTETGWGFAALAVVFSTLGLCHHAVQTQMCWGAAMTGPWYLSVALPMFFLFLIAPLGSYARIYSLVLGVFLLIAGLYGALLVMPETYAAAPISALALERLASLQPCWLGTLTLTIAGVAAVLSAAAAFALAYKKTRA